MAEVTAVDWLQSSQMKGTDNRFPDGSDMGFGRSRMPPRPEQLKSCHQLSSGLWWGEEALGESSSGDQEFNSEPVRLEMPFRYPSEDARRQ